jgi:hypothetical protein
MQQFTVPQFIDVENKIIGPITTRQFLIMLTYFLIVVLFWRLFDFALFLTLTIPLFFIFIFFAFIKINGRPSYYFVLNLVKTIKQPSIRVWNHKIRGFEYITDYQEGKMLEKSLPKEEKKAPDVSRLTELSLIVDTQGSYRGDRGSGTKMESVNK